MQLVKNISTVQYCARRRYINVYVKCLQFMHFNNYCEAILFRAFHH